jgi:hypothetical protein
MDLVGIPHRPVFFAERLTYLKKFLKAPASYSTGSDRNQRNFSRRNIDLQAKLCVTLGQAATVESASSLRSSAIQIAEAGGPALTIPIASSQ